MKTRLFFLAVFSGFSILDVSYAYAAPCVDASSSTSADLATELSNWAHTNAGNAPVTIKIASGVYAISTSQTQFTSGSLTILGGFAPGTACEDSQRDLVNHVTVLDGGGTGIFYIESNASVNIDGLTFRNFDGTLTSPGESNPGVTIDAFGSATIFMSRFTSEHNARLAVDNGNQGSSGSPRIILENCLVYNQPSTAPAGTGALSVFSTNGNDAYVINCTVADNAIEGLELVTQDSGTLSIYNTIAYDNNGGNSDIVTPNISNPPTVSYSMLSIPPTANIVSSHTINLSAPCCKTPGFIADGSDYHLMNTSLAVNAGTSDIPFPFLPASDIEGNLRRIGSAPDMGAYESLVTDQQVFTVTNTLDDGSVGSLRWAMGSVPQKGIIKFDLGPCATNAAYHIVLESVLPDVSGGQNLTIDGTTQPGWKANDATQAFDANMCVWIYTKQNLPYAFHVASTAPATTQLTVKGLQFEGFSDAAIKLEGGSGHVITANTFTESLAGFGLLLVPRNFDAVYVGGSATDTQIGGASDPGLFNLISDSSNAGIHIDNAGGASLNHHIAGNLLGVAPDGIAPQANMTGIEMDYSTGILVEHNVIDNSTANGVVLNGANNNQIRSNTIGLNYNDQAAGNGGAGVLIENGSYQNTIGADIGISVSDNTDRNFINYNAGPGVFISDGGSGNLILGNTIAYNSGLAIDLGASGPTDNQITQTSNGGKPNELQNYPILTHAFRTQSADWVQGSVTTFANQVIQIDIYASPNCLNPVGHKPSRGGGGGIQAHTTLITDSAGVANFWINFPPLTAANGYPSPAAISATATSTVGHNDTSEIGNCAVESLDMIFRDDFDIDDINVFGP